MTWADDDTLPGWDLSDLLVEIEAPPGGLQHIRRRGARRRLARRAATALVAAVVFVSAAAGIIVLTRSHGDGAVDVVGQTPGSARVQVPRPPPSAGSRSTPLDWGDIRVWLPSEWTPSSGATQCTSEGFNYLGKADGIGLAPCHYPNPSTHNQALTGTPAGEALVITLRTGALPPGGRSGKINGIPVAYYSTPGVAETVIVPSLDAELQAKSVGAAQIVATLQPSVTFDLLQAQTDLGPESGWQHVVWHGVSVDVPARWQVQRAGYGPCQSYGLNQSSGPSVPDVVRGPIHSVSGCTGELFSAIPAAEGGIGIDTGTASTVGTTVTVRQGSSTVALTAIADTPPGLEVRVTGHGRSTDVQLDLGSDPTVAARIITSLRAT